MKKTIHLIANAHLDPVWLWDRREGLNEGITTVRTMLDLMDEFEEMTFIRGEAAIYRHIEQHDPATFRRLARMVERGRWDVVGGTWIQPDTNLPATETLVRHLVRGQRYFQSRFGRAVTAGWQADSFGHSAGLPEILAAGGLTSFFFSRPQGNILDLPEPAFWWEGDAGARILAYRLLSGSYQNERFDIMKLLDRTLESLLAGRLGHAACFYGLGNHGGGPSRRHLRAIRAWAGRHPEVEVVHSGLHRLAEALRREKTPLPVWRGELNFCMRGCYSSVARFKFAYRRAEALLGRAEKTGAIVAAARQEPAADLSGAWDTVLFNSFHDILPGSSIERAMDEQIQSIGGVLHAANEAEFAALNALTAEVDTSLTRRPAGDNPSAVPVLVWNPHPFAFEGHVEIETALDYRPLMEKYTGRPGAVPWEVLGAGRRAVRFQEIATEHSCFQDFPWRKRALVPVTLPAFGWNVLEVGYREGATRPAVADPVRALPGSIANGEWKITAKQGASGVQISRHGRKFLAGEGLQAVLYDDPWGSWGGMSEEPESLSLRKVRERWKVAEVALLEKGPLRAVLWVRLAGRRSRLDLSFALTRGSATVEVSARLLLDDRSARLKLVFPGGDSADYEVPGSVVHRGACGEVPGGRWVRVRGGKNGGMGFVSDALYGFEGIEGEFRATVARASRYANDIVTPAAAEPWRPAVDCGELKFKFLLTGPEADLPRLADQLEQPPVVLTVPPSKGKLQRTGSLLELSPSSARLLALKRAEDGRGFVLRAQAPAGRPVELAAVLLGQRIALGPLRGGEIGTWKLARRGAGWKATRCGAMERS